MNVFKMIFILMMAFMFGCHSERNSSSAGKEESITVVKKPLTSTLFYAGVVQPLKTVVIISPVDGVIQEMLFHYGDRVKAGDKLFTLASEKFQTDYKSALMQYIKAKNDFNTNHSQLMQSEFLHKNELISEDEYKTKKSGFYNAQLALIQARETLNAMLKQLTVHGFNIDDLNIENINKITEALHAQGDSQKLNVKASVSGILLLPAKADGESDTKKLGKGDQVKQGDVLAVIGDTQGLTIRVNVNEFNINQLKVGQKVKVTGAAFPDFILQGSIVGIDHQALTNSSGMPTFPVEVNVPLLTEEQQSIIHMGMSAKVEIDMESEPKIVLPISAVFEKNGAAFVKVKDQKTQKMHEVLVKTGQTTLDSIVVEGNLNEGDQIVFTR